MAPGVRARLLKRAVILLLPIMTRSLGWGCESVDSRELHRSRVGDRSSPCSSVLFSSLIKIECLGAVSVVTFL